MKTTIGFVLLLCAFSSFATDITFVNNTKKDALLKLSFKNEAGQEFIFASAEKSATKSVDNFLRSAQPTTWLWVFASVGHGPSTDTNCFPRLQVKDIRGTNKNWKVIYDNEKSCRVE